MSVCPFPARPPLSPALALFRTALVQRSSSLPSPACPMTSITTLGYGITVRATDLFTASLAWPLIEQTFQFFDLILLRKTNGTLLGEGTMQGLVEKVTVETWERMKRWAVVAEMERAQHELLAPFMIEHEAECDRVPVRKSWDFVRNGVPGCRPSDWIEDVDGYWQLLNRLMRGDDNGIAYVASSYVSRSLRAASDMRASQQPIHDLLAKFGLSHPLDRVVSVNREYGKFDLDVVSLITIPNRAQRDGSTYSTISGSAHHDKQDEHSIVNVSLDLPRDANLRFIRFVKTFNLQVLEVSPCTIRSVAPDREVRNDTRQGFAGIKRDEVKLVKEISPRWLLYTSCWIDS
ncbi:uncharacterized protein JCM6883_002666 [Sporobolomyces salmoneus]|uniref:uncharacterized protein n=1 Tax=Sporobolomyces salmoneus TaxID=183962 RepID=UPI003175C864